MRSDFEPGSPPELDIGWVEQRDATSGKIYWLHLPTNRISYRRPSRALPTEPVRRRDNALISLPVAASTPNPDVLCSTDDTNAGPSSFRQRPGSASPLPSIPDMLDNNRRRSMQTRVNSSSSTSSIGSEVHRSPPPPYAPRPSGTRPSLPLSIIPLTPNLSTLPVPRDSGRTSGPISNQPPGSGVASNSQFTAQVSSPGAPNLRTNVATQTSPVPVPSLTSSDPPSSSGLSLSTPNGMNLIPATSVPLPSGPILPWATTPSTSYVYTPQTTASSAPRLRPLPPVPPELRAESRRQVPARSASTHSQSGSSDGLARLPSRSNSEPVFMSASPSPLRERSDLARSKASLHMPLPAFGTSRPGNRAFSVQTSMPIPLSPSALSARSVDSGTTVAMSPMDSTDDTHSHAPLAIASNGMASRDARSGRRTASTTQTSSLQPLDREDRASTSSSTITPVGRVRRPYTTTVPTLLSSPSLRARQRQPDAAVLPLDDRRNSAYFPSPRHSRRTGVTPDIVELSSFSNCPRQTATEPRRASTYPGTSGVRVRANPDDHSISSEGPTYPVHEHDDLVRAIHRAMPNPGRHSRSTRRPSTTTLADLEVAENYARDLECQVSSATSREQVLLHEIWKNKLEKAQRKIDELQDRLVALGRRDAELENELEKEKQELQDWDIARRDEGIMHDLGQMTETEYARLKRELDREFAMDELRERLHTYEPFGYDYDPFDLEGRYPHASYKDNKHPRSGAYRPASTDYSTYSNACGPIYSPPWPRSLDPPSAAYRAGYPYQSSAAQNYPYHRFCPGVGRHLSRGTTCSCIGIRGQTSCRKPYTHRLHDTSNSYNDICDSALFTDDRDSDTRVFLDDLATSGYSSADQWTISNPRESPGTTERRSDSAPRPRPILRRVSAYARPNLKPRGRRVSFEDETALGIECDSMFSTVPEFFQSPNDFF